MKITMLAFPLLVLACTVHCLPIEMDTEPPYEEWQDEIEVYPQIEKESVLFADDVLIRERRSPRNFQANRGGNNFPKPQSQPQPQQSRGSISGGVYRERGVGTIAHVQGQGNIWTSRNGQGRLDAQGQWSKVIRGPARSRPNYNVGLTYSHRF